MKLEFLEIRRTNVDRDNSVQLINEYGRLCCIFQSPHNNCQTYSISSMDCVMAQGKETLNILKEIQAKYGSQQLLVDIHNKEDYHKIIEDIFKKENIVFRQDYISTNKTSMSMYLLNTKEIKPLIPKDTI